MTVIATALKHMLAAGMDHEAIVAAVADMEEELSGKRTARQERNRRYYEKRLKASEQDVSDACPSPKKETSPTPPKEKTTPSSSEAIASSENTRSRSKQTDLAEFKAELADLDADRIEAIVKHRRSKQAQITGHAARLFRRDAAACELSLPDAVDTCISRNWITVKADWLNKPQARGSPASPRPETAAEAARRRLEGLRNDGSNSSTFDDYQSAPRVLSLDARRVG